MNSNYIKNVNCSAQNPKQNTKKRLRNVVSLIKCVVSAYIILLCTHLKNIIKPFLLLI